MFDQLAALLRPHLRPLRTTAPARARRFARPSRELTMTLLAMRRTALLLGVTAWSVGCVTPWEMADMQQKNLQTQIDTAAASRSNDNSQAQLVGAAMGGMRSIPTVGFEEAPKPAGGPGWYCFETRKLDAPRVERAEGSSCKRTLADCRADAKRTLSGGKHHVGTCSRQDKAVCQYIWDRATTGFHRCFVDAADCEPYVFGYAVKQSECGAAK